MCSKVETATPAPDTCRQVLLLALRPASHTPAGAPNAAPRQNQNPSTAISQIPPAGATVTFQNELSLEPPRTQSLSTQR